MKYLFLLMAVLLVVSAAPSQAQVYNDNNGYYGPQRPVLSATDQQKFDDAYAKWAEATRRGDQDDIAKNAGKMQEIMARYNIPSSVPYGQIAANAAQYGYPNQANGPYGGTYAPNGAYPTRLSPEDQRNFDKDYSKWVDATRKNDSDDILENARKMQEIMARYNIPSNTPFQAVATNAYGPGVYPAPNPAYAAPYGPPQRLNAKDQKDFDKAYKHWVDARRKKDMDDVDGNARKMQQIMARYNIPANVPFDQIATQGAGYR